MASLGARSASRFLSPLRANSLVRSIRAALTPSSQLLGSASLSTWTAVQQTSLLTAYWRAIELKQGNPPLCFDQQAVTLCDNLLDPELEEKFLRSPLLRDGTDLLAVRTRCLDDWIEQPCWPPVHTTKRQIVLLGAGMDTRAYRLGLSMHTTKIFEVDSDVALLESKHAALEAAGHRARVPIERCQADVSDADACGAALEAAGLDATVPTRRAGVIH
ncbi:MAG: hypothetical protein SGPRY_000538 [Prymnesium sp.]